MCNLRKKFTENAEQFDSLMVEMLAENKRLKDALIELVSLKNMKDAGVVKENYLKRKPRAWEVARQVVEALDVHEKSYQYREIGEGRWANCSKKLFDHYETSALYDTRTVDT